MYSAILEAPVHVVHEEVASEQVELHQRMVVTFVEGSTSLSTAQTVRMDPGVMVTMVLVRVVMDVPFQRRPCQGQGSPTLRASKGRSLQIGESVWLTNKGAWDRNGAKSVQDHIFVPLPDGRRRRPSKILRRRRKILREGVLRI